VVGEMVSIGTLFAFVLVCIGIWVLRVKNPDAPRTFRVPMVPVIASLGVFTCLFMMAFLPLDTWIRLAVWMVIGVIVYFVYSRHHSKLRNKL
jgi:APA family basic amino acid/polyamine antiporter